VRTAANTQRDVTGLPAGWWIVRDVAPAIPTLHFSRPKEPAMTRSRDAHEILIEVDGHLVASAEVSRTDDPDVVRSAMHVESGHLPPGSRTRLVDAVLDDPQVSAAAHLAASVPAGDTELLDRIRERARSVDVRAAGATALVEADLRRAPRDPGSR
jgi:hypothetical protein